MAIDTAAKRYSMMNFGRNPVIPMIIPDGTIGAPDRSHFLNLYSGIALGAETAPVFVGELGDQFLTRGRDSKVIDYSGYFTNTPTSYSISPAVPSDWTFNTSTGVLTIDPTTEGAYGSYAITATNGGGSATSNRFFVTVNADVGGSYGPSRTIKPLSYYEEKVKQLLEEEKEKLSEKLKSENERLETAEIQLESDRESDNQEALVNDEIQVLLIRVEIAALMDEIARMSLNNLEITRLAAILQDDDEVLQLLADKGWL